MNEREQNALILYKTFVEAGMTTVGACAMLGNAEAESAMRCNNVEDRCPMSDAEYTKLVDSGAYSNFANDSYGYGAFQWTHPTRKPGLLALARSWGTTIGDPQLQADYAVHELKEKFPEVWTHLVSTTDLYAATKMVCEKYECPAVNNVSARYKCALAYFKGFSGAVQLPDIPSAPGVKPTYFYTVNLPLLKQGVESAYVVPLCYLLMAYGYDPGTPGMKYTKEVAATVASFQDDAGLLADGECGGQTWSKLLGG